MKAEAAMDSAAAMPVMRPDKATRSWLLNAKVKPTSAPVSSINPSLTPSTMLAMRWLWFIVFSILKVYNFSDYFTNKCRELAKRNALQIVRKIIIAHPPKLKIFFNRNFGAAWFALHKSDRHFAIVQPLCRDDELLPFNWKFIYLHDYIIAMTSRLPDSVGCMSVRTNASATSGELTLRFFKSSLLSSCIWPLDTILYFGLAS